MSKNRLWSILLVSVIMLVVVFGIAACVDDNDTPPIVDNNDNPPAVTYVVTFNSDGGSSVQSQTVNSGDKVTKPQNPTKAEHTFIAWYLDDAEYSFDAPVTGNITLVAHWQPNAPEPVTTYTVTFDSDGGSSVQSQTVNSGELATKPDDPTKEGYNFVCWYDGAIEYDFNAPVTKNITLFAEWDTIKYNVTFDTDGGSAVASSPVVHGATVARPENPTKEGCYFEGWYVGDDKYDFATPVLSELTITARWSNASEIDAAFLAALAADYTNFTSTSTITEEDLTDTYIFKQTATLAYWIPPVSDNGGSSIYEEHLVIFNENSNMLAMYYLHDGEWLRSNLVTYADFVVALYLYEIELADVEYSEGAYHVVDSSLDGVIYALFRSTESYYGLDIVIENGRIAKLIGDMGDMLHVQTFYAFGETTIEIPENIPTVSIEIEAKNREVEEGKAIDIDELIKFVFKAKVEGKDYAITVDMVDLDGLNVTNPAVGEYTLTLTIDTWDGKTHTETATVSVKTVQSDESFADIFAKDYTNATITSGTTTFKYVNNVYTSSSVANAYYFVEDDASLTKYVVNGDNCTSTPNNHYVFLRLEILFALSSDLFEQVDDNDEYIAKNNIAIASVLEKTFILKTYKLNEQRDYSITLTIELGRVTKVSLSYYWLPNQTTVGTASNGSLRTLEYILSDFGATVIEIPQSVQDMRNPSATAEQSAIIDDKKYSA